MGPKWVKTLVFTNSSKLFCEQRILYLGVLLYIAKKSPERVLFPLQCPSEKSTLVLHASLERLCAKTRFDASKLELL